MKLNFKDEGGRTLLHVNVIGKEYGEGWLQAMIYFDQDGFTAGFKISLMLNDLYAFIDQLKPFQKSLTGQAVFCNIEDNINLILSTDGLGHIAVNGTLRHTNNPDLKTSFVIHTDQTFLPALILECNQILEHYQSQ